MSKLFEYIKLKLFRFVNKILNSTPTYSADGEDIVLRKFFSGIEDGFYVDIGAHHYKIGSNTYYLYLQGWSGVCVDPLPGIKNKFEAKRPRDKFIQKALVKNSYKEKFVDFNFFNDFPDNSTISNNRLKEVKKTFKRLPTKVIQVDAITVSDLVKDYIGDKEVHLLNIDIEGEELNILESFIEKGIKPWIICVEEISQYADNIVKNSKIYNLLNKNSYLLMGRTFLSSIYVNNSVIDKFKSPYVKELDIKQ